MSNRSASSLAQMRERVIVLLVALAAPLVVQFFLFLIASSAGAASLPTVTYGISACSALACTANGISSFWLPSGPSLPTILLGVLNGALLFIVAIVAIIEGIRLVGGLLQSRED